MTIPEIIETVKAWPLWPLSRTYALVLCSEIERLQKLEAHLELHAPPTPEEWHKVNAELVDWKQRAVESGSRYAVAAAEREDWKRAAFEAQNERDALRAELKVKTKPHPFPGEGPDSGQGQHARGEG